MVKIKHYIAPCNSGKTITAKNWQMEDPENILLFTDGLWDWGQPFRGVRYNKIIMDEYIWRYNNLEDRDKPKFFNWILNRLICILKKDGELILISTADRLYSKEELYLASIYSLWELRFDSNKIIDEIKIADELRKINYKFLNYNKVELIFGKFNNLLDSERKKFCKESLGSLRYQTDIEGKLFVGQKIVENKNYNFHIKLDFNLNKGYKW
jgi:hypothetical protein